MLPVFVVLTATLPFVLFWRLKWSLPAFPGHSIDLAEAVAIVAPAFGLERQKDAYPVDLSPRVLRRPCREGGGTEVPESVMPGKLSAEWMRRQFVESVLESGVWAPAGLPTQSPKPLAVWTLVDADQPWAFRLELRELKVELWAISDPSSDELINVRTASGAETAPTKASGKRFLLYVPVDCDAPISLPFSKKVSGTAHVALTLLLYLTRRMSKASDGSNSLLRQLWAMRHAPGGGEGGQAGATDRRRARPGGGQAALGARDGS
jgi:hypothetical protein